MSARVLSVVWGLVVVGSLFRVQANHSYTIVAAMIRQVKNQLNASLFLPGNEAVSFALLVKQYTALETLQAKMAQDPSNKKKNWEEFLNQADHKELYERCLQKKSYKEIM